MTPQQLEVENFRTWDYTSGWYSWYYETDKKIGFTARVDRGRAVDPIIRALAYNEEVGSNTQFVYSQGTFIDVMEMCIRDRDGADREIFLYSLWRGRDDEDKELVEKEVRSLLKGDIPYFERCLYRCV